MVFLTMNFENFMDKDLIISSVKLGFFALLFAIIIYTLGLCIYRLHFHPLAKFPGPRINAMSPLPVISALIRGRLAMEMKQMHTTYGPVVRIGPNELTFNTAQAWKDIYGHRQGHTNFPKDPVHAGPVTPVGTKNTPTLQYEPSEASHARQKRVLSHAFSMKALLEQEDIVVMHIKKLITNLDRLSLNNSDIDICSWFSFVTFDLTGDLAFKESFGCLDEAVNRAIQLLGGIAVQVYSSRSIYASNAQVCNGWQLASVEIDVELLKTSENRTSSTWSFLEQRLCIHRRLQNAEDNHRDFIWYVLKNKEQFDITQEEIIANSSLFIIAGAETTASALAGLFARLFYNPDVYNKLVEEIRSTFKSADEINHAQILKMPYVNACVTEGLRIHPPVPGGNIRMVPPAGDTVGGIWIPGGTTVSVGNWSASHNPENFRNPDDFIPERWIGDEYSSDIKDAMQPFSLGPRNCIGKNLAIMELRLTLVHVLFNFDILSADGAPLWNPSNDVEHLRSYMVWDKPPLIVKAIPVRR